MVNENRAESASTSMQWQLRSTDGSAQISTTVRSGPIPASESAAATLTLAGKPAAAALALPENTRLGASSPSTEMRLRSRYGAPVRPPGGLWVVMRTDLISPSAAAVTASRPKRAPVGTMI